MPTELGACWGRCPIDHVGNDAENDLVPVTTPVTRLEPPALSNRVRSPLPMAAAATVATVLVPWCVVLAFTLPASTPWTSSLWRRRGVTARNLASATTVAVRYRPLRSLVRTRLGSFQLHGVEIQPVLLEPAHRDRT
jgi:hypothetical protein